uniref:GATA type zinc finger protein Asd4 n=1 Tax=Ganoderma boninense TaxID=34458 RepID=A0A5K1JTG2_9APHY|nr:GATA type zinc finger protein Asd4 [Ganoderma boninense]
MGSTTRRPRVSKKGSKPSAPPKKASHRRPHKPVAPPPLVPLVPVPAHIQRAQAEDNDPDKYNTHNPFDPDIPLHDVTGQPQRLPRGVIACPTGGVVCARLLYPTPAEFSVMHAVKPTNRFGRARDPASSSSSSSSAPPASADATVAALVEQLKAGGLSPEDEIMLAQLKTLDMEGRFREQYHNAAEACERAEALHPLHRKLVRYRRARRDGALSHRDYAELKREVAGRRREERRAREEVEARRRAEEEARKRVEEEKRQRAEEERARAELEARRREEERLRAEEEARREAERREEEARRRAWEMEQQRVQWEAEYEQRRREEEERRRIAMVERERRDRSMIRRWTVEREQEELQARFEREVHEYQESIRRIREFEENQRVAKVLDDIRRYRVEAVASYESLWKKLRARQCPPQCFSFDNFPLPVFGKPDADKITPEVVAEFVLSPLRTDAHIKSDKNRVKDELLLWHPDKFRSVILPTVREVDQEKMVVPADNIIKILNDLYERL